MLFRSIDSHERTRTDHDREWIHTAISFLRTVVEDEELELLEGVPDKVAFVTGLVEAVCKSSTSLDGGAFVHVLQRVETDRLEMINRCHLPG